MLTYFAMWLKFFDKKRKTKTKRWSLFGLSSSKWHWHNRVKTHQLIFVDIQILQLLKGLSWLMGCWFLSFAWVALEATNLWVVQDQGNKYACVGSTMIMLARVWMPFLVNTMSIHQWEELNMVEGSACSCSKRMSLFLSHMEANILCLWQQRCCELHHGFLCARCHECNVKGGYP